MTYVHACASPRETRHPRRPRLATATVFAVVLFASSWVVAPDPSESKSKWASGLVWPPFCAGRTFEPPQQCTYNTLPRLAMLTLSEAGSSAVDRLRADRLAMATALLPGIRRRRSRIQPPGCFARDTGLIYFNGAASFSAAVNETILCARCNLTQAAYRVMNGTTNHGSSSSSSSSRGEAQEEEDEEDQAVSPDIIAAALQDDKVFALRHGGSCGSIANGSYCPIATAGICAAAASHLGVSSKVATHASADTISLLVLMGGSRIGSTWSVAAAGCLSHGLWRGRRGRCAVFVA
jgi:hypothetical protein